MNNNQYVSLEVARLLKEKGYNEWCRSYWGGFTDKPLYMCEANRGKAFDYCNNSMLTRHYNDYDQEYIAAPTLQEAMKWLRDNYKLHIEVGVLKKYPLEKYPTEVTYSYNIQHIDKWDSTLEEFKRDGNFGYETPEEAADKAILFCLKFIL